LVGKTDRLELAVNRLIAFASEIDPDQSFTAPKPQ